MVGGDEPVPTEEDQEVGTAFKMMNLAVLVFFAIALLLLPFFISIYYSMNFKKLRDPVFEKKYGEVYHGLDA